MTERDVEIVGWVGRWRAVLAVQVQARFGMGPAACYRRLGALVDLGLLRYRRVFHGEPGVYIATSGGLAVAEVALTEARIDLATYRHDLAAVWIALLVGAEMAGAGRDAMRVVGDRELRSGRNGNAAGSVHLTSPGATSPRRHYPDVAVVDREGRIRLAVELELSAKGRTRVERIMAAYVRDPDVQRVIYVTDRRGVAATVQRAARRTGADDLVAIHTCRIEGQGMRLSVGNGPLLADLQLAAGP